MIRAWLAAAAIGGFLSVAAGAVAAHLAAGDARAAELLRTGALYGMVHAAALLALAAIADRRDRPGLLLTSRDGALSPASCCSASACLRWR